MTTNAHHIARGQLRGIVTAVPSRIITNADCPDQKAADEAAKMTGVIERRWVRTGLQSARTLCTDAARRLLDGIDWNPGSIGVLVYVTQTPEGAVPADVYRIAADLGMPQRCLCLQINLSCSGYVYGLLTAMRLLDSDKRALLLVGDATSTICDPNDRATAPLFGDAGSATAIDGRGPVQHFVVGSDGSGADKLCAAAPREGCWLEMDGAAVFQFTLRRVPEMAAEVLAHGRPDYILMHQAQRFILDNLIRKMKLREQFEADQIPINVERWGNTSCCSIPLLACDKIAERLSQQPSRLALLGYGAGLAWCGASISCEPMACAELIET